MVKLKNIEHSLEVVEREFKQLMALSGVNASLTEILRVVELLDNCCLM